MVAIPIETVERRIFLIRGAKVMLDADLAEFYGVTTKVLNQQVKRNVERFPMDFMFQLNEDEKREVVTNCDHLRGLKFSHQLPYAFTEQGVSMLSSVLRSERAVGVNILIIRAFVRIREILASNKEMAQKIKDLEREQILQNRHINKIYSIVWKLLDEPLKPKEPMGFRRN